MMKRMRIVGGDEEEGSSKRLHLEEDEEEEEEGITHELTQEQLNSMNLQGLEAGATIIIQGEDGQYTTIVQQEDIPMEGTVVEGEDGQYTTIQVPHHLGEGVQILEQGEELTEGHIIMEEQQQEIDMVALETEQTTMMGEAVELDGGVDQLTIAEGVEGIPVTAEELEEGEKLEDGDDLQYQNIIIQHMDIAQPLTMLRKLLEARLQCSLSTHEFWLQDQIPLDPVKNLTSQCVQGTGMVQINVEVKSQPGMRPRLNIVDILKPAEEVAEAAATVVPPALASPAATPSSSAKVVIPFSEESEHVTRWIVDQGFRKEQERLKIPFDPSQWNSSHVRHWIQWAVKEFSLVGVHISDFDLTGKQLCDLRHEDFIKYIPNDKGDIFWTHLELLRKCKFVAVIQQPTPHAITTITVSTSDPFGKLGGRGVTSSRSFHRRPRSITIPSDRLSAGNRTGNNGQIQLWQFLLELLTDKDYREIIHWLGDEGEFKLNNPEMVAQLWGQRKNKPSMNYEKLSRALRYYYDGDMISKVHGKRFVYKFVCDLRMLLGYNAGELNRLVSECAMKKIHKVRETTLHPGILKRVLHHTELKID